MAEARTRSRTKPEPKKAEKKDAKAPAEGGVTLAKVLQDVNKSYGAKLISRASGKTDFPMLPTGIFLLDMGLLGGIPEGTGTQLFGWESSGKTTTAMRIVASAQKKHRDQQAVYFDFEGTFDPLWAAKHGVDTESLLLVSPESGEQGLDIADAVIRARDTSVVVIDSLPAIVPMKEVESSLEDQQMALQARLLGKFLRKTQQAFLDERKKGHFPTPIYINQWRMKMGVMHGDPRTLPGGNALRFVHSVGIEMLNKENTDGKTNDGVDTVDFNEHTFRIKKNKNGTSLRQGEFKMIRNPDHPLGEGFIDDAATVVAYARRMGLATGEGSAPKRFDGLEETFPTWDSAAQHMYQDLDFFESLKRRMIGIQRVKVGMPAEIQ